MIFTFPLLCTDDIDTNYVPGLCKLLELYFLTNITTAIMDGELTLYVDINASGRVSGVQLEGEDFKDYPEFIQEADKDDDDKGKGGGKAGYDTIKGVGLAPTIVTMQATIQTRKFDPSTLDTTVGYQQRGVVIGTKVVPYKLKNSKNLFELLKKDASSGTARSWYKTAVRGLTKTLLSSRIMQTMVRSLKYLMPGFGGWYLDIFLTRKGLLDASGWGRQYGSARFQRFASATLCMSADYKVTMFDDPTKLQKLFRMGWNSFLIMDYRDKHATFCSYLEQGKCYQISFPVIFNALNMDRVYQDVKDLEKASGGVQFGRSSKKFRMNKIFRDVKTQKRLRRKFEGYYEESGDSESLGL